MKFEKKSWSDSYEDSEVDTFLVNRLYEICSPEFSLRTEKREREKNFYHFHRVSFYFFVLPSAFSNKNLHTRHHYEDGRESESELFFVVKASHAESEKKNFLQFFH